MRRKRVGGGAVQIRQLEFRRQVVRPLLGAKSQNPIEPFAAFSRRRKRRALNEWNGFEPFEKTVCRANCGGGGHVHDCTMSITNGQWFYVDTCLLYACCMNVKTS